MSQSSFSGLPTWDDLRARKPTVRRIGQARRRPTHAKLTPEQVLEALRLRDQCGWSCRRIAQHLEVPEGRVIGVVEHGNGVRTVLIK